jgi:hypothetical protein
MQSPGALRIDLSDFPVASHTLVRHIYTVVSLSSPITESAGD